MFCLSSALRGRLILPSTMLAVLLFLLLTSGRVARGTSSVSIDWARQFGTIGNDVGNATAVDGSGIYLTGSVYGALPSQTSSGDIDAFLRTYDIDGNELWTRQFGTAAADGGVGIAVHGSGVYITGSTHGTLPGQTASGSGDAFVRAYDLDGNELWTRQFGTNDRANGDGIAVDGSGIYLTGSAYGALPGQTFSGHADVFVRKYDLSGIEVWTRQFGSTNLDRGLGIAVDGSAVYVTGSTDGALPGQTTPDGNQDAFVRAYEPNGTELWTRQFSTSSGASGEEIVADESGVYIIGNTQSALPGQTWSGGYDAFVRAYDMDGNELWTRQFGTDQDDVGWDVAVDSPAVYVSGNTSGALLGQATSGSADAFVVKLTSESNQPPQANAFGPYSGTEGTSMALDGSASSDPNGDSLTYSWSVDNAALCTFSDATLQSPALTCADNGSYTVTLEVSDGKASASASATVQVDNVAPSVGTITAPVDPALINSEISASAGFTDPGALDTHMAQWDWGDGTSSAGTVTKTGSSSLVSDSHTYTTPGVYILKLAIIDKDAGAGESTYQYVVVYDPDGGFVTGGGWVWSQVGWCQLDAVCAGAEGKASFGFVSRYQKGSTVPTGNTQFNFSAGRFNFHSDIYDWLVVNQAGTNAQFKGSGTINGELAPNGEIYKFQIWAGDGTGPNGRDTFRIKIWYEEGDTDIEVYDNGFDQPIDAGQIKVHK